MEKSFAILDENNVVKNCYVIEDPLTENNYPLESLACVLCYDHEDSISKNSAAIGYIFDEDLKAFIPPCPDSTYILNTITFEWEPDPELEYDLHGDGKLYRYIPESKGWMPTWSPDGENQDT